MGERRQGGNSVAENWLTTPRRQKERRREEIKQYKRDRGTGHREGGDEEENEEDCKIGTPGSVETRKSL